MRIVRIAQEIRYKKKHHPDTPPLYHDDPHAKEVAETGGALRYVDIPKYKPGPNGGCGGPTGLPGTNGGKFPCGSVVNVFGEKQPYYCDLCKENRQEEIREGLNRWSLGASV